MLLLQRRGIMQNKYLKEALEETVKEIQGYSKEELERKLSKSKCSIIAKTVDEITGFAEFTEEG